MTTTMLEPTMNTVAPRRPTDRGREAFERLIDQALVHSHRVKNTPDFALESGVDVYRLVHYADAAGSPKDRDTVRDWCYRIPWCFKVVCALIKGARDPDSPASRLLQAAKQGQLPSQPALIEKLDRLAAG